MKKIYLAFMTLSLLFVAMSCDKDLPYPIDEVKRGVVIDLSRIPGTDGVLSDGLTDGDYKIKLTIPKQQGDYSFMKHAQLLAVLQGTDGKYKSVVVVDNITEFPVELNIDIADVYKKFGLETPKLGENLTFTTNTVLNDGAVIEGWDPIIGFNNKAFSGWQVDGRAYSYSVRYPVACFFDDDPITGTFIGSFKMTETSQYGNDSYDVTLSHNPNLPDAKDIPVGVTASNLFGIDISPISPNIWAPGKDSITVWFNSEDHSLIIPDQDSGDTYGPNAIKILWSNIVNVSVSTCTQSIKFTTKPTIPGVGTYAAITFSIHL